MVILSHIPVEVIMYNIFPNVGIRSIILLTKVSKEFHKNKKNLHSYLIKNDKFLLHYTRCYDINLIRDLSNSSISYTLFDNIYEYIKYDTNNVIMMNDDCSVITKENTKQYQINNTFKILKLLKMSINHNIKEDDKNKIYIRKKKSNYLVTGTMKKYFTAMYFARNTSRFYTSFIDRDDIEWEELNVNLYNICENLNLMCNNKESDILKINLQNFNQSIVSNNGMYVAETPVVLRKIFVNSYQPLNVDIYINYVFFRYLNYAFEYEKQKQRKVVKGSRFIKLSLEHLENYEYYIQTSYSGMIVPYFEKMIMKEINDYKSYVM